MMNIKRFFEMMITLPNSSKGVLIRAEKLVEEYKKTGDESFILMAKVYAELASKNWPPWKNKQWIKENIRDRQYSNQSEASE